MPINKYSNCYGPPSNSPLGPRTGTLIPLAHDTVAPWKLPSVEGTCFIWAYRCYRCWLDDWSRSEYTLSVLLPPFGTSLKDHLGLTTPPEINLGLCCNKITVQVHLPSPAPVTPIAMASQGHQPINFLQQNLRVVESVPLGTQPHSSEVMLSI